MVQVQQVHVQQEEKGEGRQTLYIISNNYFSCKLVYYNEVSEADKKQISKL